MKPITIHPGSALVGAGIIVLAGALSAQQIVRRLVDVRIVGPVAVRNDGTGFVRIVDGMPYTVPPGRRLVLTAFGSTEGGGKNANLRIDGVKEVEVSPTPGAGIVELPRPGLVVNPGQVVDVGASGVSGRAWGYLVH